MEDQDFLLFIKKVKEHTSIDLALYKEAQMKRRLTTLRMKRGYNTFVAFFDAMMKDKELFYEFLDRMTINVSEFWRNPNRWELVEQKFIPEMLKKNQTLESMECGLFHRGRALYACHDFGRTRST